MDERKEMVMMTNGNNIEITVGFLSYQKRNMIMSQCTKTNVHGTQTSAEVDMFRMQTETLKHTLKGCDVDALVAEEGDRIFKKYFAKAFNMDPGMGNLGETSEEQ